MRTAVQDDGHLSVSSNAEKVEAKDEAHLMFPFFWLIKDALNVNRGTLIASSISTTTMTRVMAVWVQVMEQLIMVLPHNSSTKLRNKSFLSSCPPKKTFFPGTPMFVNEVLHGTACVIL